jgi:hypothetical protein
MKKPPKTGLGQTHRITTGFDQAMKKLITTPRPGKGANVDAPDITKKAR